MLGSKSKNGVKPYGSIVPIESLAIRFAVSHLPKERNYKRLIVTEPRSSVIERPGESVSYIPV